MLLCTRRIMSYSPPAHVYANFFMFKNKLQHTYTYLITDVPQQPTETRKHKFHYQEIPCSINTKNEMVLKLITIISQQRYPHGIHLLATSFPPGIVHI